MITEAEIAALSVKAWERAQADVEALGQHAVRVSNTPAVQAASADANAVGEAVQRAFFAHAIDLLYRLEFSFAVALCSGCMSQEAIGNLIGRARNFCLAAAKQVRVYCTGAECDWRGTVDETGPAGVCPKCGASGKIQASPQVVGAPASALNGNRLRALP